MTKIDMKAWADEQLSSLGLKDGDQGYLEARQAAEAGWPAHRIKELLRVPDVGSDTRCG